MYLECNSHVESIQSSDGIEHAHIAPLGLSGVFTFSFTYPLSVSAKVEHEITPLMSAFDIMKLAAVDYAEIYQVEELASKPVALEDRGFLINRPRTNGPYGIWGHDLSDLYFEGILIEGNQVTFDIGS
jgi:hypothetical protein